MTTELRNSTFEVIWNRYNANLNALRAFSQNVANMADQMDQQSRSSFIGRIANLFGSDPTEVEQEITQFTPQSKDDDFEPDLRTDVGVQEFLKGARDGEFKDDAMKWLDKNPGKEYKFTKIIQDLLEENVANGILVRRSALIMLTSLFEFLLGDLLQAYYGLLPRGDDDTDEAEHAESKLTQDEIHIIRNGKLKERLKHFVKLGVTTQLLSSHQKDLFELFERRNLFIHKDGIIDQTYLDHVEKSSDKHLLNRRMQVSSNYLAKSIDFLYFYGFILLQLCWRVWLKGNQKSADRLFVTSTHALLEKERYDLVIHLGGMISEFKIQREEMQKTVINHGIALRERNRLGEMRELIKLCEPPADQNIRIAIAVLRGKYNLAYVLILRARKAKKGSLKDLSGARPLFKPVKDDPRFSPLLGE